VSTNRGTTKDTFNAPKGSLTPLDKCPKSIECNLRGRKVLQDEAGELWRIDTNVGGFVKHRCSTIASKMPKHMFLGVWYNTRNGRTRYIGPERMRRSAAKQPLDDRYRDRGGPPMWILKGIMVPDQVLNGEVSWKEVPLNEDEKKLT